ncbi:hypothetical protein SMU94_09644, partial [Streptococcus mutans 66-2A]
QNDIAIRQQAPKAFPPSAPLLACYGSATPQGRLIRIHLYCVEQRNHRVLAWILT